MSVEYTSANDRNIYGEWLVALAVMFTATSSVSINVLNIFMPLLGSITGMLRNVTLLLLLMFQIKHFGIKVRDKHGFFFFIAYSSYIFLYLNVFTVYPIDELFHAPTSNFNFFYRTAQVLVYLMCAESVIRYFNGTKFLIVSFFTSILPSIFFIQYVGIETLQVFGQDKESDEFINSLILGYCNGPLIVIGILFYNKLLKNKFLSILFAAAIIVSASFVLMAGGERGPIIWTVVNLVICLFMTVKNVGRYVFLTLVCGILFFLNFDSIIKGLEKVAPHTAEKMESTVKEGDTNGRFNPDNPEGSTYIIAWNQFLTSPLYGSYFRLISNHRAFHASYPHNIFLEMMMTMGLLGLLPFVYLLLKAWGKVRRSFKHRRYTESQLLCLILFLSEFLKLLTTGTIVSNTTFWAFFYIVCNFDMPVAEKGVKKMKKRVLESQVLDSVSFVGSQTSKLQMD